MPIPLPGLRMATASFALLLTLSSAALAQFTPAPDRPVAASPRRAPAKPRPVAAPAERAASCHNGLSFERFLGDLKQQAVDAGAPRRAMAEASPYLVYD